MSLWVMYLTVSSSGASCPLRGRQISAQLGTAAVPSNPPINLLNESTGRMHVAFRGLRLSPSSRAFRRFSSKNELRCRHEAPEAPCRPAAVQRRNVHSFRNTTRSNLSESGNRPSSTFQHFDTIYALSSGAGRAAIAVIRVSGPACLEVSFII